MQFFFDNLYNNHLYNKYFFPHLLTSFVNIGILTSILDRISPYFLEKVMNSDMLNQLLFSFSKLAIITTDHYANMEN